MDERSILDYQADLGNLHVKLKGIAAAYADESKAIADELKNIDALYQDKIACLKPQIMMYGIYNAGKSSIINALLGKEAARVADVPTTDSIDKYQWHDYEIADTPGVDAPIEHERVTEAYIRQADVVLFVMSNTGSHDKAANYERMAAIDRNGKQLLVIINDKQGELMSDEPVEKNANLYNLAAKVRSNLHSMGVRQDCKIVFFNADMARQARSEESPEMAAWLFEHSQLEELQKVIISELKKSNSFKVLRNGVWEIDKSLCTIINELTANESSQGIQHINNALSELQQQRISLRKTMKEYIDRKALGMGKNLPDIIWQHRDNQEAINQAVHEAIDKLSKSVQNELEFLLENTKGIIEQEMENLLSVVEELNVHGTYNIDLAADELPDKKPMDAGELQQTVEALKELQDIYEKDIKPWLAVKESFVPEGSIKDNSSMSKNLAQIASIVVPMIAAPVSFVGKIVAVAGMFLNMLGNSGAARRRAQEEAMRQNEYNKRKMQAEIQARQDLRQKCEYMAEEVADELAIGTRDVINNIMGAVEGKFQKVLQRHKDVMNARSNDIAALRDIDAEYNNIINMLGYDMRA